MGGVKTKAIERLEKQIADTPGDDTRRFVLECARDFKTSWIELGRALYSVKTHKLYRDWGFNTFEGYAAKEIGIQKMTALKLIRSYAFLEKEEPSFIRTEERKRKSARALPHYEAVDTLRAAREQKKVDEEEYDTLKQAVFEEGKDHRDIKKSITAFMKRREEESPEEARTERRKGMIKRFISNLKSTRRELDALHCVPQKLLNEAEALINKFEEYMN